MKTGIYLIKNKLNGKCYVGQSIDIEARWKQHIIDSKKPEFPIHKAIAKYGVENFDFSVLEECSFDELDAREIEWIEKLDTYNNGYNCTLGGGGSNQGKDCYSAEYKRAAKKAFREAHKDDPEFKKKERAERKKRYEANKDDTEFKEKVKASNNAYYEANKDDPEFKMKKSARQKAYYEENKENLKAYQKAYYEAHKDDPEFKEKRNAYQSAYKESHKLKPTTDHTDMPLW